MGRAATTGCRGRGRRAAVALLVIVVASMPAAGAAGPGIGPGFDPAARVTTDFFGGDDGVTAIGSMDDGRLVVFGGVRDGTKGGLKLARYLPNGQLDGGFGPAGRVISSFSEHYDGPSAATMGADGTIIAAGQAWLEPGGDSDWALVRFPAGP